MMNVWVHTVEQHPARMDLPESPTEEVVIEALGKLKGGKAVGKSGILPGMVKGCGGKIMDYILDLFHTIWR